jgi:hypothetical protein
MSGFSSLEMSDSRPLAHASTTCRQGANHEQAWIDHGQHARVRTRQGHRGGV